MSGRGSEATGGLAQLTKDPTLRSGKRRAVVGAQNEPSNRRERAWTSRSWLDLPGFSRGPGSGYGDCFEDRPMSRSARGVSLVSVALALLACGDDGGSETGAGGGSATAGSTSTGGESTTSASGSAGSTSAGADASGTDGSDSASSNSASSDSASAESGGTDGSSGGDAGSTGGSTGGTATGTETDSGGQGGPECDVDVTCTGDTVWSRKFGNSDNANSSEGIAAVATDAAGFSYVGGSVAGMADFGDDGIIEGPYAGFVAKIDSAGDVVWVQELQAETALEVHGIDIDDVGNVTVAGSVRGDLDAGGGPIEGDGANWDVYMASYDTDGGLRFADIFGSYGDMETLNDVAVHADGNIALTGRFGDDINFGGDQLHATGNSDDVFVAVFDQDGAPAWSRRYGDSSSQIGDGVSFDGDANVIVAARNYATIDFGGMPHQSDGNWAIAVAKLDATTGERIWSRQFDNTEGVWIGLPRIEADADAIYLGTYSSSANINSIDWGLGAEEAYFYLVKFDQSGDTQWSRPFASLRGVQAIEPDFGGAVVAVGDLQGTADFGGTELTSYANSYDAFIAKYDASNGDMHWARAIGDYNQQSNIQRGAGVGIDAQGSVYVGGSFYGAINFGDGQLTASNGFGGSDGYLARLEP